MVCDEPVSALDVSIQSQILNLLLDPAAGDQSGRIIFIAHDLAVVKHISDRIAIMYLGRIVESGEAESIYRTPASSLYPGAHLGDSRARSHHTSHRQILVGDVPSPINPPSGCAFHTRCPKVMDICKTTAPALTQDHQPVSCHLHPV
jgi:oligopeptide/dipeptide ABC transporter ATP-binding protein